MASPGNLTEEQVHCSICLDVFTNPVSIPCGHNFCQICILSYWKSSPLFQCPMCKKTFYKRPDISINTVLREIAEQFKHLRVSDTEQLQLQQQELKQQEKEEKKKMEQQEKEDQKKKEQEQKLLQEQLLQELKQKQGQEQEKKKEQEPKDKMAAKPEDNLGELPPLLPPPPPRLSPTMMPPPRLSPSMMPPPRIPPSLLPPARKPPVEELPDQEAPAQEAPVQEAPAQEPPGPSHSPWGKVFCDVCMGDRLKAVKSCLVCLTSYCEEHIKNHNARFSKHKLIEPVANLEDRMCQKHERLLELFCKKDQTCVCVLCTETDHRAHYTVPVEREWTDKKAQLKRTELDVQQMIQDRLRKVEEIKHSVELNKSSAQREVEDSMQVFSELVRSIQRTQADLVLAIEDRQRETEGRAQALISELEKEINELERRNTDLGHLSRTEDHIHFLQSFPSLCTLPPTKDWSGTSVHTEVCVGIIRRAVSKLEETLSEEIEKLTETELKRILKYTVDLTLDPDTASPWLQLSEDRRQVRHLGAWQDLPDNPERFDTVVIVLGREAYSSGRHYWEVQVGDKDDWYLGVARASVKRKGRIAVSTAQGYWALAMKKGREYRASTAPPLLLTLDHKPKRVGVYVDYEEGQVSFYDVRTRSHIYTFMDTFRDKIVPFFYLYCCDKASDTMVICPVSEKALIKQC